MKAILLTLSILLTLNISAQKKPKVKGNKEVIEVLESLEPFTRLEINDGLEVTLMQTESDGYRLMTDSNLTEIVRLEVVDSILKIYSTHKISSKKKLEIGITFRQLEKITLRNDAKIEGMNKFELTDLILNTYEGSDFELDVNSKRLTMNMNGTSQGKIQIESENTIMTLNDNTYLNGTLAIDSLNMTVNKRADMKIEGHAETMRLVTTGSTDIKAKELKVTTADLMASNTSDIYVYVSKDLNIYAKGKSFIYVYGTPNITVDGLNGKSQIIKK